VNRGRLCVRDAAKRLFQELGLGVRSFRYANTEETLIRRLLPGLNLVAVPDVGANIGKIARVARNARYRGVIVSFAALRSVHFRLTQLAKTDARWTVAAGSALGSEHAEVRH
jgi:hypothetical protein